MEKRYSGVPNGQNRPPVRQAPRPQGPAGRPPQRPVPPQRPQQAAPARPPQRPAANGAPNPNGNGNSGKNNDALVKAIGGFTTLLLIALCVVAVVVYLIKGGKGNTVAVDHGVEITEIMTSNKGSVADEFGGFPDWIELHNTTNARIDIGGFGLSDSELGEVKWTIPVNTTIDPDGYLVIWCSGESKGRMHAAFKLSAGERVTLSTESGTVVKSEIVGVTEAGMTWSKDPWSGEFRAMEPTPGFQNSAEGRAAYLATMNAYSEENPGVYINEFMASNASTITGPDGTYCDWIELYNTSDRAIDLSGYGLSDTATRPLKSVLPQGTTIAPHGVLLIFCTGRDGGTPEKPEVSFGLASYKESVVLSTPAGKILDSVDYERAVTDHSIMRSPDGTGLWQETTQPTPGYPNNQTGLMQFMSSQKSTIGQGPVVLSEVLSANYSTMRQADLTYPDWIELHNTSSQPVNLGGYGLSKNAKNPAKWVFPDYTLGAGEYLVVLATGTSVTDTQKKNLSTNFTLSPEGDTVFLFTPEGKLSDKLQFGRAHADVSYGRSNGELMYFSEPTPGTANGTGSAMYVNMPSFSVPAGCYDTAQSVSIRVPEGATVYYTVDGSVPTEQSTRYDGTLNFTANTVLRARAFRSGFQPSDTATASYFIAQPTETIDSHKTDFAIVSLVSDNAAFFDKQTGIYIAGQRYADKTGEDPSSFTLVNGTNEKQWKLANFNAQHETHPDPLGLNWERPCHVEIIDENGVFEYGDDAMVRIFGAFSRFEEQKGMSIVTRGGYGTSALNDKIFATRDFTEYKSVTLRPSAMDWKMSKIRDILIQGLVDESDSILPTQAYRRCVVYINGRYWGIYNIRQKVNKDFLAQTYHVDASTIDILVANGVTEAAQIAGVNAYLDYGQLIEWVKNHDLSKPENYAYVQQYVDVENFAEYCAMEIYVGNTDTGNIKFWRSSALDNKWRWIPYDFDWAFNRNDDKPDTTTSGYRRNFFEKYFHEKGHGVGKGFSTVLSRGLLRNSEFRALFLRKCALFYTDWLTSEKLLARIDRLVAEMENEIKWDTDRWSKFSLKTWQNSINNLKDSAANAPEYFLKYCQQYFSLSDSDMITLFGKVSSK
ncbi:MAG: lamin tail domain-containing protein [Clostridia bacterium]|nr:lamin tail domain-containing protein [Clostridia bacterium]